MREPLQLQLQIVSALDAFVGILHQAGSDYLT